LDGQSVIARTVTVAGGRYAPGHLGELTQLIPFEMVDAALACTGKVQARVRDLPSRVVVYLLLAACLFPGAGYPGVWRKLTAGLAGLQAAAPTAGALAQARRRAGVAPLQWLFDLLRGPAATPHGRGTWWRGLLVCAIDGTTMTAADTTTNLARFTKHGGHHGGSGYPLIRVMVLAACGTRTIIDAVFGPAGTGEVTYTFQLLRSLRAGMIVLLDRNFAAAALITAIAGTEADVLVRVKNGRNLPALRRYPDGSCLSLLAPPGSASSTARSPSAPGPAAALASTGWPLPCWITTATQQRSWSGYITSAGRSRPPTWRSNPQSSAAGSCGPAPPPGSTRRSTPCWSPTRSCAPQWRMRQPPSPAPTRTGPASASPCRPPATSSSRPLASSPGPPST
jgi:Insertion element 4 transposase N-terminal/Transposase DDE domain